MTFTKIKKLSLESLDALREVFSIGVGSASGSLSKMTDRDVRIKLGGFNVLTRGSEEDLVPNLKGSLVGIIIEISEGLNGTLLILSSRKDSLELCDIISKNTLGKKTNVKEIDIDILSEMASILVGSYLAAFSTFASLNIVGSTPNFIFDKADKIAELIRSKHKDEINYFFELDTTFLVSGSDLNQKMVLILADDSFQKLFNAMVDNNLQ